MDCKENIYTNCMFYKTHHHYAMAIVFVYLVVFVNHGTATFSCVSHRAHLVAF